MKPIFLLLVAASSLMSCTGPRYQLTTFAAPEGFSGAAPNVRQHDSVTIEYDFSGQDNEMSFMVQNHTGRPLFLDFAGSYLMVNDVSVLYSHGTAETVVDLQQENLLIDGAIVNRLDFSGTGSSSSFGAVVLIPPNARSYFQRITLPTPLMGLEVERHQQGTLRVHQARLESAVGSTYRHVLSFRPGSPDNEPFMVEDSFVVVKNENVTVPYYQGNIARIRDPKKLISARRGVVAITGNSGVAIFMSVGAAIILVTAIFVSNGAQ